ncbi:exopolyphosphatase [Limosilactobacillus sp. STM2_1]|uniref:Exopolyphosphatase n=1 Tax=Limosilactobacillus rudii TaxID=2759755 RepID=A0A7W3YND7_9LACO|nr:exopolyphosphatase [Limosilactobacillus rudii]MBB1080388.1 exopolyphosphatase [Limosilactobacillus rudii]MBB1098414.1 exopolyphosphatase [Limosilactobacillus rudii]MCD7135422.1 exopolyphosphatase [Limosilactobacillus rudii]
MKKSLTAIIYLEPDQVSLRIVEIPTLMMVNSVRSGLLNIGKSKVANYSENMAAIVSNIEGFKQIIKDYQASPVKFYGDLEDLDPVTARYVSDQLEVRTGLQIEWLNNNQLMAQSMSYLLTLLPEFAKLSKHNMYLLSIGLSSTTLAYFHHGNFERAWDIDLGNAKISHLVNRLRKTATNPTEIIQDYISSKLEYLTPELTKKKHTVMMIQNALALNKLFLPHGKQIAEVPLAEFHDDYQKILSPAKDGLVKNIKIDDQQFELLLPNYLVTARTVRLIQPAGLYVTDISTMDGISHGIGVNNDQTRRQINGMIRTAADNISERYGVDSAHRDFVTQFSLQLFDQLRPIHRLGQHERLLLEIASRIDDIGNFINQRGHYRHSAYIMEATPLIGLSDKDNRIIAEVARYHSAESPDISQAHYRHLDDDIQMPVAKLAAILRLVDALDDSRLQKISKIKLTLVGDDQLIIKATANDDLVLEKWSFSQKSQLFRDVYGIQPVLTERSNH